MGRTHATKCRVCGSTENLDEGRCATCRAASHREWRIAKNAKLGIKPRTASQVCKICGEPRAPNRTNLLCVEHLRLSFVKKYVPKPPKPPKVKVVKVKAAKPKAVKVAPYARVAPPPVVPVAPVMTVGRKILPAWAPVSERIDDPHWQAYFVREGLMEWAMRESGRS